MTGATTYTIEYFPVDALAWLSRALLSLAGVEYKNIFPDWPADKEKTPFGRLPVLTEIDPDGSKFVLAESRAVELYLAKKFGFLPKDSKQEAIAIQYHFQILDVCETFVFHVYHYKNEASRDKYLDRIKIFIQRHEPILAKSKSGYYCGDSLTLPDICLYYLYKTVTSCEDQSLNLFASEQTPAISKLAAMVVENPGIKRAFL
ncbi:hypothetical protein BB560_005593 [Smittium megazygosporum]|uniref:GST N-terminal domain-containing protein n=1 Tax=Smittium megazygosporum TaxID=133381 RepID=A0A2T9Z2Q5_9FUNG|nr:hypothetical protein BB560_005593 [Smittium megazygosporum]